MAQSKELVRVLVLLALAALLESGGDAGMRRGLQGRTLGFLAGAVLLIGYGLLVNLAKVDGKPLDFSKLMGLYIAVFFVVSQLLAIVVFKEQIALPTLVGGALIVAGGCLLTFWKTG